METFLIILFLFACGFHNYVLYILGKGYYNSPTKWNDPEGNKHHKAGLDLFDLGHQLLPDCHEWALNLTLIFMIILFLIFGSHRWHATRVIFGYLIPIMTLRMITTLLTILPPSAQQKLNGCGRKWKNSYFLNGHVYDKVFSGHTTLAIILAYVFAYYSPSQMGPVYAVLAILEAFFAIATKGHYSVDVVMAIVVTISFIKLQVRV